MELEGTEGNYVVQMNIMENIVIGDWFWKKNI